MTDIEKLFAERLKTLRESQRLTQDELAEKAGISRVVLNYYERGTRSPQLKMIVLLANALGVPVVKLLQ